MNHHFTTGIDAVDRFFRRFGFGTPHIGSAMDDLPLQIGEIDFIEIEHAEFADAGGCQIHRDRRTQPAGADAKDAGGTNLLLAGHADFRQDAVSGVAANLFVIQFHTSRQN